jgi:hypothetical protein
MKYEIRCYRQKLSKLTLRPDIDPKDPRLEPGIAQAIFIHKHADKFFDELERKLLRRILDDIGLVLQKGWAKNISKDDFFHGHICGKSSSPVFDLEKLFSPDNIVLLYHTLESSPITPDHYNRNILSTLQTQPTVVRPKGVNFDEVLGSSTYGYGVGASDLGLMGYAKVYFEKEPEGVYELKDGTKLSLRGLLFKDFYVLLQGVHLYLMENR